tara:strand:+ start:37278 stop:38303 length:1026 start_codon:yes stop_codon:yes gene_type:complete
MNVLVTGAAGFIGFHLIKKLLNEGYKVIGIDNLNDYYDINLKLARLKKIEEESKKLSCEYIFKKIDLCEKNSLDNIFEKYNPDFVLNMAAQAGVRYSVENPNAYIQSNLVGFSNLIENCRIQKVKHFLYASSSSVYGGNILKPFSEKHSVAHPISLYAATKRSNELIAHCYSHLYRLPTTGLRFFTVYGPWGRPDMSLFLFTKSIINNNEITVFNNGNMIRDFTYIDDITETIIQLLNKIPESNEKYKKTNLNPNRSWAPYRLFNIGNSSPIKLMDYINILEKELGKKAIINFLPIQPGDVTETSSDNSELENLINFKPNTSIEDGIKSFVNWYKSFYREI